jgi:hypothetical protein
LTRLRTRVTTLIRLPYRSGLQLDDRPPDTKPDLLPVVVAAIHHLIGTLRRDYLRVATVLG